MDVKCTESNSALFVVDKIYRVRQVFGVYCDETDLVVIDEDGDSRNIDLDSDDFEYIPPVTYSGVDEFLAEQEDEDDDYD